LFGRALADSLPKTQSKLAAHSQEERDEEIMVKRCYSLQRNQGEEKRNMVRSFPSFNPT
jgi:hypothetical protein